MESKGEVERGSVSLAKRNFSVSKAFQRRFFCKGLFLSGKQGAKEK